MSGRSQIESGAELFARLKSKGTSLHKLEDTLFANGPRSTDVIEIGGDIATGKTLLLLKMLGNCILPHDYHRINGCNASAILINTDHHFQTSKLIEIVTGGLTPVPTSEMPLVQSSLNNLRVINCYNSEQFSLTLQKLDDIFFGNSATALLAIDSMTAYYWQDREFSHVNVSMDSYVNKLLKLVKLYTTRFNVTTVYTRYREHTINSRRKRESAIDEANYKIYLGKTQVSQKFVCTLASNAETMKRLHYSISSSGIKWETDQPEG